MVDTTIVSVALPSVRAALAISVSDAQWVLNAYALACIGFALLAVAVVVRGGASRRW